jgi:hypothetical protein
VMEALDPLLLCRSEAANAVTAKTGRNVYIAIARARSVANSPNSLHPVNHHLQELAASPTGDWDCGCCGGGGFMPCLSSGRCSFPLRCAGAALDPAPRGDLRRLRFLSLPTFLPSYKVYFRSNPAPLHSLHAYAIVAPVIEASGSCVGAGPIGVMALPWRGKYGR